MVGVDLDARAVELAREAGGSAFVTGAPELEARVLELTRGRGLDAVLICAASRSTDPVALAARLARDRGRLVVVGDVPVEIDRALAYEKELELRLARSYGPGRYDVEYEERGRDLPAGYVRWTEQRNIQAFVDLLAGGRLDISRLTTHRFPVERAAEAYELLTSRTAQRPFGIVLEYEEEAPAAPPRHRTRAAAYRLRRRRVRRRRQLRARNAPAGLHRGRGPARRRDVAGRPDGGGHEGAASASSGWPRASTTCWPRTTSTRSSSRRGTRRTRELTARALEAGKAVFVEKPLAVTAGQLAEVEAALRPGSLLMVGFNRRYRPARAAAAGRHSATGRATRSRSG